MPGMRYDVSKPDKFEFRRKYKARLGDKLDDRLEGLEVEKQWTFFRDRICAVADETLGRIKRCAKKEWTSETTLNPINKDAYGVLLADKPSQMQIWTEYFSNLLTRPTAVILEDLCLAASSSVPNPEIVTDPPTLLEINQAVARMKLRKAPGCCISLMQRCFDLGVNLWPSLRCLCAKIWESE